MSTDQSLDIHNQPEPDTDVARALSEPLSTEIEPARLQAISMHALSQSLEDDISRHMATLRTNNVTMNTPLVDAQGFPLQNVDLVAIRTARQRINILRNDNEALRERITILLNTAMNSGQAHPTANGTEKLDRHSSLEPFARINSVAADSPAETAGLRAGDLLLQFGSITKSGCGDNLRSLAIPGVVVDRQPIRVSLKRDTVVLHVTLIPLASWGGRGLLGCHLVAI